MKVDMAQPVILTDRPGAGEDVTAPAHNGSPVSFAAIREELARNRRSRGGRPGLVDADRKKIPVTDEVWHVVERVASHLAEPGFRPSAGQVAGVLLNIAARELGRGSTMNESAVAMRPGPLGTR
jgi:hypothetical protein